MQLLDWSDLPKIKAARYAFFDGDNIGNAIENLLNSGRVKEATHLSESIKLAIFKIELFVESKNGAEILISGGDDILVKYDFSENEKVFLEEITKIFNSFTGLSMSCGVGSNVNQALANLMTVKSQNKGEILLENEGLKVQDGLATQSKLYIFTTSERPDPYINVIAHCAANYQYLNQVTLIGITEDRGKILSETDRLKRIKQNITDRLDELSDGKYRKKIDDQQTLSDIQMEPADRKRYSSLKGLTIETKVLDYQILEKEISSLIHSPDACEHIFDVTAVAKGYLVDVYVILRFKNISAVHTFEIFKKLSFDERDLIHNLVYKKTYAYTCLAETTHTRSKMILGEGSIVSENELNRLQSDFQMLENERIELENRISTDFARFWSMLYFFILLSLISLSYWKITQPGGWDWLEPTIYVVTSAWFLLIFLLQLIFSGKAPSFDPKDLFISLKDWKKKKLEKNRTVTKRR